MTTRHALSLALAAVFTLAPGCAQQEGDVCQEYGPGEGSDCGEGLECCGEPVTCDDVRGRGICVPTGTCAPTTPPVCDEDGGAGTDAGPVGDAGTDAGQGEDAGPGEDAGTDAGPGDAGFDAGFDAGTDAGPGDAGFDAGTDAG